MKMYLILLAICTTSSAFAADKICFGTKASHGTHFVLSVTTTAATISESNDGSGMFSTNGTYQPPAPGAIVHGRDGVTYLDFDLGSSDGANDLLVDSDLLNLGGIGFVKMRNRGEGYEQTVFLCRDKQ